MYSKLPSIRFEGDTCKSHTSMCHAKSKLEIADRCIVLYLIEIVAFLGKNIEVSAMLTLRSVRYICTRKLGHVMAQIVRF
jgi:hypothetical protein